MTTEPKTSRGKASRERILAAAAARIHLHGVRGTQVEEILRDSDTGKSQFYHYFDSKEELVRAVAAYQGRRALGILEAFTARFDTWEGIEAWFQAIIAMHRRRGLVGGCPIGSLAAEMADEDRTVAERLSVVFESWRQHLAAGLTAMQRRGELRPDADPEALASFAIATKQGGILVATTMKSILPLENALTHALAYLRSFAA